MKAYRGLVVGLMVGLTLFGSISAFARQAQPGDNRAGSGTGRDAAALEVQLVQDRGQASLQGRQPEPGDDSRLVLQERELLQRNRRLSQSVIVQPVVNDDNGGTLGLPEPGDDEGGLQAQPPETGDDNGGLQAQQPETGDDNGGLQAQPPETGDDNGSLQAQPPEPGDDKGGLPGQHTEPGDDKGGQQPEPGDNKGGDGNGGHEKGGHA